MKEQITEEQKKKLNEPLPKEAVAPHPTKGYLSTIKAIYVVERLNEVFGLGGWKIENHFVEKVTKVIKTSTTSSEKTMVVVKSKFTVTEVIENVSYKRIYVESYGGNDNDDLGDAYKGACTDALTKIGSYLGIGMDVFKGLGDKEQNRAPVAQKVASKPQTTVTPIPKAVGDQMLGNCENCGAPNKLSQAGKKYCSAICWEKK